MKSHLHLKAQDEDDLAVMSATLQDAILVVKDLAYIPKRRRFAAVVNRFRWEDGGSQQSTGNRMSAHGESTLFERIRTGLHFDGVEAVRTRNILQDRKDAVLALLAIKYEEDPHGAGEIRLIFSGGGIIALRVECIEATLRDLGQPWSTSNVPHHGVVDELGDE